MVDFELIVKSLWNIRNILFLIFGFLIGLMLWDLIKHMRKKWKEKRENKSKNG